MSYLLLKNDLIMIRDHLRLVVICLLLGLTFTQKISAEFLRKTINWDPVSVFRIQWILNAGLPEARLSLNSPCFKVLYLNDGNVIVGKAELDNDSFYVIQVDHDLAEEIPAGEKILIFKRNIQCTK